MSIEAVKIKLISENYKQKKKTTSLIKNLCLLGFVCRSINLQIFTEISRFFGISLQIFGVLRLSGLLFHLEFHNNHKS